MGVISVRLNAGEEKMLKELIGHFHEDKSRLIKMSLKEMYYDLADRREINAFEVREKQDDVAFVSVDAALKELGL